ncbi:hypothetical protein HZH66_003819 [Vespula vulgaris]|uniref:Uncharacterized protein n=1 Tax=Vespula vulgaris TaxID=7454 RepID=A0A834NEW8_VESVU|nr:hypothetical protein HZH66_003819 [Vespula vulgaris]
MALELVVQIVKVELSNPFGKVLKEKGNLEFGELTTEDVKVRSMENEASKVPALTFAGSNISKEKRIVRRYWTTTMLRTRWEIQRYKISRTLSGLSSPFRSPSHYLLGK